MNKPYKSARASPSVKDRRLLIVISALILAVTLFAAGLISGLYVARSVEQRQREDIFFLERKQQEDTALVREYVDDLQRNLQSFQLQEQFVSSLARSTACALSESYFTQTTADLDRYWRALPSRLEAYERSAELDSEYLTLKEEYTRVSIRAWLIARDNAQHCNTSIVPALYFYDATCEACEEQGLALDTLKQRLDSQNRTFIAFTIDSQSTEPVVSLIKQYYNVSQTPAIIANELVRQGELLPPEAIEEMLAS